MTENQKLNPTDECAGAEQTNDPEFKETDPKWFCWCCTMHVKEASRCIALLHTLCLILLVLVGGVSAVAHAKTFAESVGTVGATLTGAALVFLLLVESFALALMFVGLANENKDYVVPFIIFEGLLVVGSVLTLNVPFVLILGYFMFIVYRCHQYFGAKDQSQQQCYDMTQTKTVDTELAPAAVTDD